jgi:hypothetical protein
MVLDILLGRIDLKEWVISNHLCEIRISASLMEEARTRPITPIAVPLTDHDIIVHLRICVGMVRVIE